MSEQQRPITDSSIARMAGNIAAGMVSRPNFDGDLLEVADQSVKLAYLIASEIEKHEPFRGHER